MADIKELQKQIEQLTATIKDRDARIVELEGQANTDTDAVSKALEESKAEVTGLKEKVATLETAKTEIEGQLEAANAENKKLQDEAKTEAERAANIASKHGGIDEPLDTADGAQGGSKLEQYKALQKEDQMKAARFMAKHSDEINKEIEARF